MPLRYLLFLIVSPIILVVSIFEGNVIGILIGAAGSCRGIRELAGDSPTPLAQIVGWSGWLLLAAGLLVGLSRVA